jgi:general secretion pathway protein D
VVVIEIRRAKAFWYTPPGTDFFSSLLVESLLMRKLALSCTLLFAIAVSAQQAATPPASAAAAQELPCSQTRKELPRCNLNPKQAKEAAKKYQAGMKLASRQQLEPALQLLTQAAEISPSNVDYVTAREMVRQKLVYGILQQGNEAMLQKRPVEALGAFRQALTVDPQNQYAQQRLRDSLPILPTAAEIRQETYKGPIWLQPDTGTHEIHFRGSSRELLTKLASTYGLNAVIDENLPNRTLRADIEQANWAQASGALTRMARALAVPLSAKQVLFVENTQENRNQYESMALRTYYIPGQSTLQQLNDLMTTLRVMFDLRFVSLNAAAQSISVRAQTATLDAVSAFLDDLHEEHAQVLLDVTVYQISSTYARSIGLDIPRSFTVFNLLTEARKLLGNQTVSEIEAQLLSGNLTAASATAAAAALASQGTQSSILTSTSWVTFGGGLTWTGITVSPATLFGSVSKSDLKSLENVTLRASQNNPAVLKIGQRYPIVNAIYSSSYVSTQRQTSVTASTYNPNNPYPSFNYEDLGFNLKATPKIHRGGVVSVDFELQLRSLGASTSNGIPIINNHEYKGAINCLDGEPVAIAGLVEHSVSEAMTGYPGVHSLPGIGKLLSTNSKDEADSEILILVTPRILTSEQSAASPLIPLPANVPR